MGCRGADTMQPGAAFAAQPLGASAGHAGCCCPLQDRKVSPPNLPDTELYMTLGDNMARIRSGKTYKPITPADIREFRKTGTVPHPHHTPLRWAVLCHTCGTPGTWCLPLVQGGLLLLQALHAKLPACQASALLADPVKLPHVTASVICVKPHHAQSSNLCDYCGCEEMPSWQCSAIMKHFSHK